MDLFGTHGFCDTMWGFRDPGVHFEKSGKHAWRILCSPGFAPSKAQDSAPNSLRLSGSSVSVLWFEAPPRPTLAKLFKRNTHLNGFPLLMEHWHDLETQQENSRITIKQRDYVSVCPGLLLRKLYANVITAQSQCP